MASQESSDALLRALRDTLAEAERLRQQIARDATVLCELLEQADRLVKQLEASHEQAPEE
jgi:hypothetical protein